MSEQRPPLERPLFTVGLAIWLFLAVQLALLATLWPEQGRAMAIGLSAELLTGREGGLPAALQAGYHPMLAWETSVLQDFGTAFLGYPVFLYALHRYYDRDVYLMRRLRRIEQKAAQHQGYVHRWGPLGIAVFMLIPFLVNGPFIGLVLGRLTGIHTRDLLAPVIVATIVVAGAWTFFVDAMLDVLEAVDPRLGWWAAALAVAVVVVLGIIDFAREHRHARKAPPSS